MEHLDRWITLTIRGEGTRDRYGRNVEGQVTFTGTVWASQSTAREKSDTGGAGRGLAFVTADRTFRIRWRDDVGMAKPGLVTVTDGDGATYTVTDTVEVGRRRYLDLECTREVV